MNPPNNYWFRAKWYGWGWSPATWQGWLVTLSYVGILGVLGWNLGDDPSNELLFTIFLIPVSIATFIFIFIAYKTGEKPGWHWGPPKN